MLESLSGKSKTLPPEVQERRDQLTGQTRRLLDGPQTTLVRCYEVGLDRSLSRSLGLFRELQAMTGPQTDRTHN